MRCRTPYRVHIHWTLYDCAIVRRPDRPTTANRQPPTETVQSAPKQANRGRRQPINATRPHILFSNNKSNKEKKSLDYYVTYWYDYSSRTSSGKFWSESILYLVLTAWTLRRKTSCAYSGVRRQKVKRHNAQNVQISSTGIAFQPEPWNNRDVLLHRMRLIYSVTMYFDKYTVHTTT